MQTASESLHALAADPHYLGGTVGMLAVLHTWTRTLGYHLLRRIFEVDPLSCPRCRGPMRILTILTDPAVITRILAHRARGGEAGPRSRGLPP